MHFACSKCFEILEKLIIQLAEDYKRSTVDFAKDFRSKPFKSGLYLSLLAAGIQLARTAPTEGNFYDCILQYSNDLNMLSATNRSAKCNDHIKQLVQDFNNGEIRHLNFIIFTLIWVDKYGKDVDLFPARCRYTNVGRFEMFNRVVDIGIANRWLMLKHKMANFDVSDDEMEEFGSTLTWRDKLLSFR